jgi:hypothetical protein
MSTEAAPAVRYEVADGVATLTLDRPDAQHLDGPRSALRAPGRRGGRQAGGRADGHGLGVLCGR